MAQILRQIASESAWHLFKDLAKEPLRPAQGDIKLVFEYGVAKVKAFGRQGKESVDIALATVFDAENVLVFAKPGDKFPRKSCPCKPRCVVQQNGNGRSVGYAAEVSVENVIRHQFALVGRGVRK